MKCCEYGPGSIFTMLLFIVGPVKLKHHNEYERLAADKHTSLLDPFVSYDENEVLWIWTQELLSQCFSLLLLTSWPIKVECYIKLSMKDLLLMNTLAYWTHLYAMKKMKCCGYRLRNCLHNASVFCYLQVG
jgi:hypothetical protein